MRLCQRESENKKFYDSRERAQARLKRINEEKKSLPERLSRRLNYAESEFLIVSSTYYYYLGLVDKAKHAILQIDSITEIYKDTAQYINYLYQLGSGGLIEGKHSMMFLKKNSSICLNVICMLRKENTSTGKQTLCKR